MLLFFAKGVIVARQLVGFGMAITPVVKSFVGGKFTALTY